MALNDFSQAANAAPRNVMIQAQHIKPKLTPKVDKQPVKIVVPEMNIEAIPTAMRRMGWTVAAALMERWFASPEWTMPEKWKTTSHGAGPAREMDAAHFDDRIVTMDWALDFDRCQEACTDLVKKIREQPTVRQLIERLNDAGWNQKTDFVLGEEGSSARAIDDTCQVNFIAFGRPWNTLDDMYGALGRATLKMGLIGEAFVNPAMGTRLFQAKKIGIYIRDHYDFIGQQSLGTWTEDGVLTKADVLTDAIVGGFYYPWRGQPIGKVDNDNFSAFKKHHHRGGDFMIFSDVHWITINEWIDLGPIL